MLNNRLTGTAALLIGTFALTACGGGGGSGGSGTGVPTPSVAAALSADPAQIVEAGSRAAVARPVFGSVVQSAGHNVATIRTAGITRQGDILHLDLQRTDGRRIALNSGDNLVNSDDAISLTGRTADEAVLLDADSNSITVASGLVDYDPNNPGDWIAGGTWLHVVGDWRNGRVTGVEIGAIVDGPELSQPASVPATGTASYRGPAAGLYAASYGTDSLTPGASEAREYDGQFTARANFAAGTVSGEIDIGALDGVLVFPDGRTERVSAIHLFLQPAAINSHGSWVGGLELVAPGYTITRQTGSWGSRFSTRTDRSGHPRLLAGTHAGSATTRGGTETVYVGAHAGVTGAF